MFGTLFFFIYGANILCSLLNLILNIYGSLQFIIVFSYFIGTFHRHHDFYTVQTVYFIPF